MINLTLADVMTQVFHVDSRGNLSSGIVESYNITHEGVYVNFSKLDYACVDTNDKKYPNEIVVRVPIASVYTDWKSAVDEATRRLIQRGIING